MKLFPAKCHEQTMTSNGKQFTVNREMLTAVARDQRWLDVVAGISACFSKFAFVLFCYMTSHLMTGPFQLAKSEFFPLDWESQCFPQREILGKQNSLFPSGPVKKSLTGAKRGKRGTRHCCYFYTWLSKTVWLYSSNRSLTSLSLFFLNSFSVEYGTRMLSKMLLGREEWLDNTPEKKWRERYKHNRNKMGN